MKERYSERPRCGNRPGTEDCGCLPFQTFGQLFWRWQVGVNNLVENGRVLFHLVLLAIGFAQHLLRDCIAISEKV